MKPYIFVYMYICKYREGHVYCARRALILKSTACITVTKMIF